MTDLTNDPLERLRALQGADLPVHGGRTLAYVYDSGDPEVDRVAREAVAAYAASNALDPTAFPSLLRMENELVGFACGLLELVQPENQWHVLEEFRRLADLFLELLFELGRFEKA